MGNSGNALRATQSESGYQKETSSRVLLFLHRTWAIILTSKARARLSRTIHSTDTGSQYTSQFSQYSFCSCSQCQRDDVISSGCFSDLFESASNMAPNTEVPRVDCHVQPVEEIANKEKQRPPIYNPEDYGIMLKKWGKKSANGGLISLYANSSTSDIENTRSQSNSFRDYRNPMLTSSGSEMTLRQFGTVSELLTKLKSDLRLAFPSFVQEFVADPLDGVTLLLDLLRTIQINQSSTVVHGPQGSTGTTGKIPPSLHRRALLDEFSCLQCLLNCCARYTESIRKLISSSAGLFTVAVCIMSNVNKSRIIALQLLIKACDPSIGGHTAVSEAMSTLRLRFGEPVRFRFLVGMLTSAGGHKELIATGLKFLNTFLDTALSKQKRLYIQAELDQAGLDMGVIKKNMENCTGSEQVWAEIYYWEKTNIDIDSITTNLDKLTKENECFKERITLMERKVKILQEEKGILVSLEKCLKERCGELQTEIHSLKSDQVSKSTAYVKREGICTPNEDEGISSSERSLSPDDDIQRDSVYEAFKIPASNKNAMDHKQDDEEETTIDEVIEELRNIINDAETEEYAKMQAQINKNNQIIEEAQVASKLHSHYDADDYTLSSDTEIIPQNLHPQPPRKAKSLVHLFVPSEDYYYCPKQLFFENDTPYTSEEGSDSLLSASKCQVAKAKPQGTCNMVNSKSKQHCRRHKKEGNVRSSMRRAESLKQLEICPSNSHYYSTSINIGTRKEVLKDTAEKADQRFQCKSLDRIDVGLNTMVDIVVTDQKCDALHQLRTKSDVTDTSQKTSSNIYVKRGSRSRFSSYSEDKKIFLPLPLGESNNSSHYFPRVQERRVTSTSFLVKRGHANAGLYSGQLRCDSFLRNKDYLAISGKSGEKVTDLPSGLY
ncbi:uncharacterized protein LOC132698967 [Cylas formicarius]|uniref:uncharacterized protein LOC132698967 n=1 Tax=Cylas formicarius TaxID=197179 RepID=UPI002958C391|nr:uncharacterized protein LOC132698967 [Cylas formicarius]